MSSNPIKNIGIVLKPKNINKFRNILPNLTAWLARRSKSVFFSENEFERLNTIFNPVPKGVTFLSENELLSTTDLIISLGGDGTLIGVCRKATKKTPPIFGVNMGKLGFITEFSQFDFYDALTETLKGEFRPVRINLYNVTVLRKEKSAFKGYFLNDAVISKNDISRMFNLTVESNNEHIYNVSGDGLIISSPIGSTAYSLAAGGPIIHPEVNSMVLTPICPHSLTHRPLVIPDNFSLDLRIPGQEGQVILTIDGQQAVTIGKDEIIKVTKSKSNFVQLIKNPKRTYFHTLKEKLTLGRSD